jgi:hypothetical protein
VGEEIDDGGEEEADSEDVCDKLRFPAHVFTGHFISNSGRGMSVSYFPLYADATLLSALEEINCLIYGTISVSGS